MQKRFKMLYCYGTILRYVALQLKLTAISGLIIIKIKFMRNIFMAMAVIVVVTACNSKSNTEETSKDVMSVDTSSLYNSGLSTDTGSLNGIQEAPVVVNKTDNLTTAPRSNPKKAAAPVKPVVRAPKPSSTPSNNSNSGTTGTVPAKDSSTTSSTTTTTTTTTPAQTQEKKGMSSATKGAIIGGVGGAVGGAIISKKKGKGAIIGVAVGAAGGYILGRKKDKKNQADTAQ